MKRERPKLCLISSSGGHFEQLSMLKPLGDKYDIFLVTEKRDYIVKADYFLSQNRKGIMVHIINTFKSLRIWFKEKPDYVISTGTKTAAPMLMIAKLFGKKIIYIETFARIYDGTKAGKFFYPKADLFIYQWETLSELYPNGVFGGSIY